MSHGLASPLEPGTKLGGRYDLVRLLGAGGVGAVYEARGADGSPCAIKVLHQPSGSAHEAADIARFLRESKAMASVRHPHVVSVSDAGTDGATGLPYLVMELLSGRDLETVLETAGILAPRVAVRIAIQACRGLAAAHSVGLIHRDVKPLNLFLHSQASGEVVVKVCDFGLAKWLEGSETLTQSGAILGTPHYSAPEQLTNAKRVDQRGDLWGIGMTLYRALCGRSAYSTAKNLAELHLELQHRPVPPLQDAAPWAEPGLAMVVHGALVKSPADRCPSAEALAEALEPFAGDSEHIHESMLVRPPESLLSSRAPRVEPPSSWADSIRSVRDDAMAPASELDRRLGSTIGGRWKLERVLGKGGMGVVYEAADATGTHCALKLILGNSDSSNSEAVRRFVREGRMLMALDSPYVVRLIDVDTDPVQNLPYFAMEMLSGRDLAAVCRREGALEAAAVLRIAVQVCEGLAAAHAAGVVHRDIKPGNIFLHELDDGTIVPKICDFGVAKRNRAVEGDESTTDLTRSGGILGSPMYMSPEQARSAKTVDPRTDVWSLGVSLWEALSGVRAWQGCGSVGELIVAICTRDMDSLGELAPWLDPELVRAVHKALHREPKQRYATALEFAAALEPFAAPSSRVHRNELRGVQASTRLSASSRIAVSASPGIRHATSTMGHASTLGSTPTARGARRSWRIWAAAAGLAGLVGGAWTVGNRLTSRAGAPAISLGAVAAASSEAGPTAQETGRPVPSAQPAQPGSAAVSAVLQIHPSTAAVSIDGRPASVVDGGVVLEGQPGQRFEVRAVQGDSRVAEKVILGADGSSSPSALRVPLPLAPSPSLSATATAAGPPPEIPAAPMPPTSSPGGPNPKDTW